MFKYNRTKTFKNTTKQVVREQEEIKVLTNCSAMEKQVNKKDSFQSSVAWWILGEQRLICALEINVLQTRDLTVLQFFPQIEQLEKAQCV